MKLDATSEFDICVSIGMVCGESIPSEKGMKAGLEICAKDIKQHAELFGLNVSDEEINEYAKDLMARCIADEVLLPEDY